MIPRGWYVVCTSADLERAGPRSANLFGTTLHLQRNASGEPAIRDEDGELPAYEIAGAVFAWYGGHPPDWRPGPFPELADRRWTQVHWLPSEPVRTTVQNAQRDVVDNAHFGPVHGLRNADTRAWDAGHAFDTVSQGIITLRRIGGPPLLAHLSLDGRLHGPGLLVYRTTVTIGFQISNLVFSAVTPIDDERCVFFAGVSVRKLPLPGVNRFVVKSAARSLLLDYESDAAYWSGGRVRDAAAGEPTDDERRMDKLFHEWLAQYLPAA
jgi:phenylpropionate dioxygenase-like ring-hydroxylating dioxygenase large terminal subunit